MITFCCSVAGRGRHGVAIRAATAAFATAALGAAVQQVAHAPRVLLHGHRHVKGVVEALRHVHVLAAVHGDGDRGGQGQRAAIRGGAGGGCRPRACARVQRDSENHQGEGGAGGGARRGLPQVPPQNTQQARRASAPVTPSPSPPAVGAVNTEDMRKL